MSSRFINAVAQGGEAFFLLLGRLAIAAVFVPSGFGKLGGLAGFAHQLGMKGLPVPMAWAVAGALVEFLGGLAVAVGFKTRYAALFMIAFTIAASLISHPFWTIHDAGRTAQYVQFMKNMAIIGGFLFLFVRGPGSLSIDRRP